MRIVPFTTNFWIRQCALPTLDFDVKALTGIEEACDKCTSKYNKSCSPAEIMQSMFNSADVWRMLKTR